VLNSLHLYYRSYVTPTCEQVVSIDSDFDVVVSGVLNTEARTSLRHPTSSVESLFNADISGIVDRHSGYTRLCVLGMSVKHSSRYFLDHPKRRLLRCHVGLCGLLCLIESNQLDDDEVLLFVIVYSFHF
jgi:hypothetical protein